ncbi:hypothetical protein BST94_02005 [Nonlabens xylanidelens]|nr:hypothetical protein BST94_02005 [Nonlabens xylanidelens]
MKSVGFYDFILKADLMKNSIFIIGILILCASCSTSKMTTASWKSDGFDNQTIDKILVYANTDDQKLQKEFEDQTAQILIKEGIFTYKMHDIFPDIVYKEVRTQEEIAAFVEDCKEKQISKILFATKKSQTVDTVMSKSLHNYMNGLHTLSLERYNEDEPEYDTKQVTTYVIEAAVYDINEPSQNAPIATTSVTATDPKSLDKIKDQLLKSIKQLFNK